MKVGVLGMGSIGKRHAANLRALGHEVIEYDNPSFDPMRPDPKRDAMIAQSDAIVIATPSDCHFRDLLDCMACDTPTFVEKPIATTDAKWRNLHCYRSTGRVFMGNNLRFHPCIQQAKWWMDNGDIGTPIWATFTSGAMSVKPAYLSDGVLMITGSHEVDLALHLLGPVSEVLSANVHCAEYGDDIADFVLQHENGARSSFHLDFITPNEIRESWIVGTEKNIGIDLLSRRASLGAFVSTHDGSYDADYVEEMRAFIQRIEGVEVPGATGDDGLAVLRVLLDVKKKAGIA